MGVPSCGMKAGQGRNGGEARVRPVEHRRAHGELTGAHSEGKRWVFGSPETWQGLG